MDCSIEAYLKLKENRKELTKTQNETKEKYKGQIVDVPKENLFEISQIMNHFTRYSRRKPNGDLLSEARLLHYGIKMVYSDTNLDKNTTVKSAFFNGKGQIVGLLNDIDKKYLKDHSLLFEPGNVEKFISSLKALTKFKDNTKQQKIELLNTLLKEYPGFQITDEMSNKRDIAVKTIGDATVHQFTPLTQALKINDQKTKTYTPWQTISVEVPTGFKLKYSVYKVESLDVNYIENRGRNRRMDEDAPNLKKKQIWEIANRDYVKSYNREYYLARKAKKELAEQARITISTNIE